MFKFSNVALLSALLLSSGCAATNYGKVKSSTEGYHAKHTYCYCPSNTGVIAITHFAFDSSVVLEEAQNLLQNEIAECVASRLIENPELKVLIVGHADKRGTQEYNLALGSRRASATKEHLTSILVDKINALTEKMNAEEAQASESDPEAHHSDDQHVKEAHTNPVTLAEVEQRFCIDSKGKAELVDKGDTELAHAKNRRATIEFVKDCN